MLQWIQSRFQKKKKNLNGGPEPGVSPDFKKNQGAPHLKEKQNVTFLMNSTNSKIAVRQIMKEVLGPAVVTIEAGDLKEFPLPASNRTYKKFELEVVPRPVNQQKHKTNAKGAVINSDHLEENWYISITGEDGKLQTTMIPRGSPLPGSHDATPTIPQDESRTVIRENPDPGSPLPGSQDSTPTIPQEESLTVIRENPDGGAEEPLSIELTL